MTMVGQSLLGWQRVHTSPVQDVLVLVGVEKGVAEEDAGKVQLGDGPGTLGELLTGGRKRGVCLQKPAATSCPHVHTWYSISSTSVWRFSMNLWKSSNFSWLTPLRPKK